MRRSKWSWRSSAATAVAVEGSAAPASGALGGASWSTAAAWSSGDGSGAGPGPAHSAEERPAGGSGGPESRSGGGLLAAPGWDCRTGAGRGGVEAELVGDSRGRRGSGHWPGGAQERATKCGKLPPPSSSSPSPRPRHTASSASWPAGGFGSLARPACPPRCFRPSEAQPPGRGGVRGPGSTGVRCGGGGGGGGGDSADPGPREDARGLARAQKARARRHSGENSRVPRRGFRGVGEQGDPRGDAGTASRAGGHRVSMEQPAEVATEGARVPAAGCLGCPKSPRAWRTSPPPLDGEVSLLKPSRGPHAPGRRAPRFPAAARHAALPAAGRLGPPRVPARSAALPAAAFSGQLRREPTRTSVSPALSPRAERTGGDENKAAGGRGEAGRTPAPAPGARAQAAGRAPSARSASFFPAGSRRPRSRELPPRCPNTSAGAASAPLIGPPGP